MRLCSTEVSEERKSERMSEGRRRVVKERMDVCSWVRGVYMNRIQKHLHALCPEVYVLRVSRCACSLYLCFLMCTVVCVPVQGRARLNLYS